MLSIESLEKATTTFVSQNCGAGKIKRANRGTAIAILIVEVVTVLCAGVIYFSSKAAVSLFTDDAAVIEMGTLFVRTNIPLQFLTALNFVIAGSLRGRGDSRTPTLLMLVSFVGVRQIYLFFVTRFILNTPRIVSLGYPIGWFVCSILLTTYYLRRYRPPGT